MNHNMFVTNQIYMKNLILSLMLISFIFEMKSQNCNEMIDLIKSKGNGSTYTSYNSDAISKVTFYDIFIEYKTYYFAIVCFKQKYSYSCSEYLYQVASNTKFNYSMNYHDSAGKAFWKYIQPYNEVLKCAPEFD